MIASFALSLENAQRVAQQLRDALALQRCRPTTGIAIRSGMMAVTQAQVQAAARKYLAAQPAAGRRGRRPGAGRRHAAKDGRGGNLRRRRQARHAIGFQISDFRFQSPPAAHLIRARSTAARCSSSAGTRRRCRPSRCRAR